MGNPENVNFVDVRIKDIIKVKIKIKYPPFIISNILKCPTYSCRVLFWFVVVFYARFLLLFRVFYVPAGTTTLREYTK